MARPPRHPLAAAVVALVCGFARGGSIENCGGQGDHLSNVDIKLSPDPLAKGKPFTLTVQGDLDEDHVGGSAAVNLEVKALGIIDKSVAKTANYTLAPGIPKGPAKFALGPVTLPTELPGEVSIAGRVQITDQRGEPVACVKLNLQVPVMGEETEVEPKADMPPQRLAEGASPVTSCAQPSDHLANPKVTTSGGVTTATATLDEDLAAVKVHVDLTIKELFVKVPIKLDIPMTWSPPLAKGDWKVTGSESFEMGAKGLLGVTAQGQIVINDGKDTEVTCVAIDSKTSEPALVV